MANAESPLVTIVTPCLNAEHYIEECIASVRAQSYPRVEHVIVDGKSTDGTLSIIKKHEHEYNMRWVSEIDRGSTEATNKGMRMAEGAILGILPSDDLLLPWAIGTVVQEFQGDHHADLVYGDLIRMPYGGKFGAIYFDPPETSLTTHLRFNSIAGMAIFFQRRVFEALNGFDEQFRIVSDYDFWLRAAEKRFKFSKVDEVLACFQFRKTSISVGNPAAHRRERLAIGRKHHLDQGFSLGEAYYYLRRVMLISGYQLGLILSSSFYNKDNPSNELPWKNLVRSGCISRDRLMREILFSPLLSTNNEIESRISHGYVRMDKLRGMIGIAESTQSTKK